MIAADTQRLTIPTTLLTSTLEDLENYGSLGCESIAFFLARHESSNVVSTLITAEDPGVERSPLFVRLSEGWILSLTDLCEERNELVVGQIHAHGISAFHSETDDHHLFHAPGILSLVVPNFASTERDKSPSVWACFVGLPGGLFTEIDLSTAVEISEGDGDHLVVSELGWRNART